MTWLELFYDLIYVAAISITAHVLTHAHHGAIEASIILKYILIFVPLWWAWTGFTVYVNRFGKDDTAQRVNYFVQMAFVIVMAASINIDFEAYYLYFMIGYVGIRLSTVFMYARVWRNGQSVPQQIARFLTLSFLVGALISFSSVLLPGDWKFIALYFGIFLDIALPLVGRRILIRLPVHHPHLLERYGLATIILLGEMILVIVNGLREETVTMNTVAAALIGFVMAVAIWWHYFESSEHTAEEEQKNSGQLIIYGHLFMYMSIGIIASVVYYGFHHDLSVRSFGWLGLSGFGLYTLSAALVFHNRAKSKRQRVFAFYMPAGLLVLAAVVLLVLPTVTAVYAALAGCFVVQALLVVMGLRKKVLG